MVAAYTMATDKTGRELLVVTAKGTYGMPPHPDLEPQLLEEQFPLVMTDLFTGEPGLSAPIYELDFAPRKPRCDVLLNGSCYAPGARPATSVLVGMRVGSMTKSFNVIGNRTWKSNLLSVATSPPAPFLVMPLSYNNAYGGIDRPTEDTKTHQWYLSNPVGVGYHPRMPATVLDGKPLPNTEEIGHPVLRPGGDYKPMAFGPIGRSWQQRVRWAGTYDQRWKDETFPFLPGDFDDRYFQSAPEDQQIDFLKGGEEVVLVNLSVAERLAFRLPTMRVPFEFFYKSGGSARMTGIVDTLVLEPELTRFTLSSRATLPLHRNIHEIHSVTVGRVLPQPLGEEGAARPVLAKPHYKSLADLVAANRIRRQ
jgi:hypothetical protein